MHSSKTLNNHHLYSAFLEIWWWRGTQTSLHGNISRVPWYVWQATRWLLCPDGHHTGRV